MFSEHLFLRTPLDGCFCSSYRICHLGNLFLLLPLAYSLLECDLKSTKHSFQQHSSKTSWSHNEFWSLLAWAYSSITTCFCSSFGFSFIHNSGMKWRSELANIFSKKRSFQLGKLYLHRIGNSIFFRQFQPKLSFSLKSC